MVRTNCFSFYYSLDIRSQSELSKNLIGPVAFKSRITQKLWLKNAQEARNRYGAIKHEKFDLNTNLKNGCPDSELEFEIKTSKLPIFIDLFFQTSRSY